MKSSDETCQGQNSGCLDIVSYNFFRVTESFPFLHSFGWDNLSSPTLSVKSPSPTSRYPAPDPIDPPHGNHAEKMNKKETRDAVIDFVSRKTGKSFEK